MLALFHPFHLHSFSFKDPSPSNPDQVLRGWSPSWVSVSLTLAFFLNPLQKFKVRPAGQLVAVTIIEALLLGGVCFPPTLKTFILHQQVLSSL